MKCQLKYKWVKLPRNLIPSGKGIMGAWARLASRAAFRNGQARYCSYINQVTIGSWAGGIVGLKSILGIRNRNAALKMMDKLAQMGYIDYELNPKTKKLTYQIKDWVVQCSGEPCMGSEAVYATQGYGFLCLPRDITQRLVKVHYHFEETDAWLDLWCHTVWQESGNAFSHMAPAVQYGRYGAVLTLEILGHRWGWEKTKVWRFFQKHADAFPLQKLPGSFGCLIFNAGYPSGQLVSIPSCTQIKRIIGEIRTLGQNAHLDGCTDHERIGRLIAWYSGRMVAQKPLRPVAETRVALSDPFITRAYFSLRKNCRNCFRDCQGVYTHAREQKSKLAFAPRAGPGHDIGGLEYGRLEGIPLW